ncbi:ATP-binding protein [Metabacillus sp. GX 13764]|uniref:ATP-binding protein n=1 Tax=Metabacillus kandeliae TaxID=2900151 RepID=UPI001E29F668|nr:ATP-binding protein [Metabacillus kandeliae]MCD7033619.1 ATP-binding protein [Metabacillus kandeliae]
MSILKDFLLQLAIMVIPIFSYFTLVIEKVESEKRRTLFMTLLWGVSILLCMAFPISFGDHARLDLRILPLLFGSLYGGFWPSIFLSAFIILYRLTSGISAGLYSTVLVLVLTLPIIWYYQKTFLKAARAKKVFISSSLSFYYCLLGLIIVGLLSGFSAENIKIQLIFLLFVTAVAFCFIMLVEKIRENHQLRKEMQNAEKLRVISELASVFAHEIRNPMQVTRGFLQLLNDPDLPDDKKKYVQISIEELDRANEIIHDFLLFGKPSADNRQRVDAGLQLKRAVNIIQNYSFSFNAEIKMSIEDNCWIHANSQQLNQSLINILKNAAESMENGGTVSAGCTAENGYVRITIKDQGIGMTESQMARLGSPFYSLKESGTGLGMMVSYQIIRSFGGSIEVNSAMGAGTEFIILLPHMDQ